MKCIFSLTMVVTGLLACSSGPRYAKLDTVNASSLDLILVGGGTTFCVHGEAPQVKAVITMADGKRLETWSRGERRDGRLKFEELELSASLGSVDSFGELGVGSDPFAVMDNQVVVSAAIAGRPEVKDTLTLRPTFDCGMVVNVSGDGGRTGMSGTFGRVGRGGASGDSSRDATDGEDGGHGQTGGQGARGADGPEVVVALGQVNSQVHGRLVMVRVSIPSRGGVLRYMLINPKAGKRFVIAARGGSGGGGGGGGSGGNGGSGGSNNVQDAGDGGHGGDGGDGGHGGNGADGGDGGRVTVLFDQRFPDLSSYVAVVTSGGDGGGAGSGGYGGAPGAAGASASGKGGTAGRTGVAGQPGIPGRSGRDGQVSQYLPTEVQRLFSAELGSGLPIVN